AAGIGLLASVPSSSAVARQARAVRRRRRWLTTSGWRCLRRCPPVPRLPSVASVLVLDSAAERHLTLVDAQREAAVRIGAHPRLEHHGGAFLPIVGERDQQPIVAFLALGQLHLTTSSGQAPARQCIGSRNVTNQGDAAGIAA